MFRLNVISRSEASIARSGCVLDISFVTWFPGRAGAGITIIRSLRTAADGRGAGAGAAYVKFGRVAREPGSG